MPNTSRTIRSRIAAAAAAAGIAAATAVATAGVADAADVRMRTATTVTDDYAYAEIYSIGFSRDSVSWSAVVWDRCGADGRGDGAGAYLRGRARFGDGTWSGWTEWRGDSSGCADGGWTSGNGRTYMGRVVTDLQLQLCEVDNGDAGECVARVFDNPRVGG